MTTIAETIMVEFPADTTWTFDHEDASRSWTIRLASMVDPTKTLTYLVGRGYTINMQNKKALSKDQKAAMVANGKDIEKYVLDGRNRITLGYENGDFDDTAGAPRLSPEESTRRDVIRGFLEAAFEAQKAKDGKTRRLPDTMEALQPIFDAYMAKPANKAKVDKEVAHRLAQVAKAATADDDLDDLAELAEAGRKAEDAKRADKAAKAAAKELAELEATAADAA